MPNMEYEAEVNPKFSPNAKVIINSIQRDAVTPDGVSLFNTFMGNLNEELDEDILEAADKNGVLEIVCEGEIKEDNGRVVLKYLENADLLADWVTTVSFDINDPNIITVERSGAMSHALVIDQGVRQFSVYTTPYGPFEMCVYGKKVSNLMTANGGSMVLDYTVELKGMTAQRTTMTIEVIKK